MKRMKESLGLMLLLSGMATGARAQVMELRVPLDSIAVTTIDQDRLRKGIINNALDALNGQAAGVNVTSSGQDRMAMLSSIRVRGTTSIMGGNDPLVIIDGATADITALASIYPADIESFTILKDAAETSMYGSQGAAGVIEVKTKKGSGKGFQISYEANCGLSSMYKHLEMLSASEYLATADKLGVFAKDGGYDTDFYDAITRTAFVQNHYLAFSGGTEQSNYRASFGYNGHNTIIRSKGYDNLVAKIDVTQKAFGDRLVGDFGIVGLAMKEKGMYDSRALFYAAAAQNPTFPYGDEAKNEGANSFDSPSTEVSKQDDTKDISLNAHMRFTLKLTDDLSLSAFGSYVYSSNENDIFIDYLAYREETKRAKWLGSLSASYGKQWGIHALKANASLEYQKETMSAFWTKVRDFVNGSFGYDNMGAATHTPYGYTGSSYEDASLASVMGNVSYTLLDRYTVQATARFDGSSMVGSDHTWGFFPSLSLAWNLKQEQWLQDVDWLSMLRIRTGWGYAGSLAGISAYISRNTVKPTGMVPYNGAQTITLGQLRNNNPDLKWELKTNYDVSADLGLWNNRLVITAAYYYSKTTDMLYNYDVPVPPYAFDKLLANIGSMSNQGLELGLSITPIAKKDIELNINTNWAWQKNKLISLSGTYNGTALTAASKTALGSISGAGQNGGYNNVVFQMIGQPLGVFYLPHCTGLYTDENGNQKYQIADLNGDGETDLSTSGDRYIAGQATPKLTMGSNISLRYKDWYLSLQVNGAFGHKIFNGTALAYNNMSSFPTYNVMKGAPERNIVDQNISDYWLERGDYVNFEYLTLGYDVPLRSKVIRSLRVSASINNLGTITSYSGLTPIINSYAVNSTLGIDDKNTYPLYRTYSIGLSVQF